MENTKIQQNHNSDYDRLRADMNLLFAHSLMKSHHTSLIVRHIAEQHIHSIIYRCYIENNKSDIDDILHKYIKDDTYEDDTYDLIENIIEKDHDNVKKCLDDLKKCLGGSFKENGFYDPCDTESDIYDLYKYERQQSTLVFNTFSHEWPSYGRSFESYILEMFLQSISSKQISLSDEIFLFLYTYVYHDDRHKDDNANLPLINNIANRIEQLSLCICADDDLRSCFINI